ncbi:MAG: N-acetylmuramoyl-L-alanine amidase [Gammaproteobacteria bacterium]|nr:N-acetylmuramoyl-L-alanine amidase [Gammaproteobacteria bacterium]
MRPLWSSMHLQVWCRGSLVAAALACLYPGMAFGTQLLRGTLDARDDRGTLTLQLSGEVRQRLQVLTQPDRIVLDLADTRATGGWRPPAPEGVVRAVRAAERPHGAFRVVLELERPMRAVASLGPADARSPRTLTVQLNGSSASPAAASTAAVAVAAASASVAPVDTHAPRDSGRDIIVAVDAGHGGDDPGASGRGGTREKVVTLAIARALAARIDATPGMRAVLTRDDDRFIALRERTARAAAAGADLFVSIHADAVRDRDVEGASVYVLSERGASSEAARWLAERENAADERGGVPLADVQDALKPVLMDLSQSASIGTSAEVADRVLRALDDVGAVRKREVQRAGFMVLKSRGMPALLIETAYISNPGEERKLRNPDYQQRLAEALRSGIIAYFRQHPPEGTLYARQRREAGGGLGLARSAP